MHAPAVPWQPPPNTQWVVASHCAWVALLAGQYAAYGLQYGSTKNVAHAGSASHAVLVVWMLQSRVLVHVVASQTQPS